MLFKIGDKIIVPKDTPCAIIFADDEERKRVIEILANMVDKPGEFRFFSCHASGWTEEEFMKWTDTTDEMREKMKKTLSNKINL